MVKNLRQVKVVVHKKVPEEAILDFFKRIPNKDNITLYRDTNLRKATYHFLYQCVTGLSNHDVEREVGFPHSNMRQVFGTIRHLMADWADTKIGKSTLSQRRAIARSRVKHHDFANTTLVCDSIDLPLLKQDERRRSSKYYSYKLQRHGLRYIIFCTHDKVIQHTIGPFCPKDYDSHCIQRKRKEIQKKFVKGDKVLADNHYTVIARTWKRIAWICKYTKPPKKPLSAGQEKFNQKHSAERSKVENVVGDVKRRFKILCKPYYKSRGSQFQIWKIACAMHNWVYGIR